MSRFKTYGLIAAKLLLTIILCVAAVFAMAAFLWIGYDLGFKM